MNTVAKFIYYIFLIAGGMHLLAQEVNQPGPKQEIPLILRNATIHPGNGSPAYQSDILIENGKIQKIGLIRETYKRAEDIDLSGKNIYPGLIALNSQLGLAEIEAARPTIDTRERGDFNAGLRAIVAYNTDSRVIGTVRSNGILLAQTVPQSGILKGISGLVQLDAWNWEDAAYGGGDNALCIQWPQGKEAGQAVEQLEMFFSSALARMESQGSKETDLNQDALTPVLKGNRKVFIHANQASEIMQAIAFAEKFKLNLVISGGYEAWKVKEILAEKKIPVVLSEVHRLPAQDEELPHLPFMNPFVLQQAGVSVSLSVEGFWQIRNLPFMAGTAAAYGLSKEQALQMIALNPAKCLGVDSITGSIEVGKDANLVICSGDILDMKSSIPERALIQGRWVNLDNKQHQLYEKYRKK